MTSITASRNHLVEIKRTLQLGAPVIVGMVAGFGMNFVDTLMAGRIDAIALSAIAIGGAVWSIGLMFMIGCQMAVPAAVSQLDGAGQQKEAAAVTRQALWIAVGLSVLFFIGLHSAGPFLEWLQINPEVTPVAIDYMQALSWGAPGICIAITLRFFCEGSGNTKATLYMGVIGVLLNIPLNYILMFGKLGMPAMGAVGCGYATSIVIWVQALVLALYILKHSHFRPFGLFSSWDPVRWRVTGELLLVGLPIAGMLLMEGGMFIGASLLIGRLNEQLLAAHQIAINFAALMFMIPLGLASAITVRVGNAIGRKDFNGARTAGTIGLAVALGFQTLSAIIMLTVPALIVGLYTSDARVTVVAVELLFFAAIFQLSDGFQVCAAGGLRGLKDTRVPMIYSVIAYWAIGMVLGYYLTFTRGLGPKGMWIGMIAGLTVAAVLLGVRFWRSSSRLIAEPVKG